MGLPPALAAKYFGEKSIGCNSDTRREHTQAQVHAHTDADTDTGGRQCDAILNIYRERVSISFALCELPTQRGEGKHCGLLELLLLLALLLPLLLLEVRRAAAASFVVFVVCVAAAAADVGAALFCLKINLSGAATLTPYAN